MFKLFSANILTIDTKESITSTILQVYETEPIAEAKPQIDGLATLIKKETKRKRRNFVCPTCKVDQVRILSFPSLVLFISILCMPVIGPYSVV